MNKQVLLTTATLAAAGCAGPSGPSPTGLLVYDVPSPAAAVYHITDTMAINVSSPIGDMEITGGTALTLGMTFESAPGGVRVTGILSSFEASMNNPMQGAMSVGLDDVSGSLELLLGRLGDVEVVSLPELSGPAAQMSPFSALAHEFFPRFADAVVEPGGTWVDTVTWATDTGGIETTSTTAYTYTLVGDTVVDGRTLLHIGVAGEVGSEATMEQGGMSMSQSMTGTLTGFLLWDRERGLPLYAESERDLAGTTSVPSVGSFDMTLIGPVRARLQN